SWTSVRPIHHAPASKYARLKPSLAHMPLASSCHRHLAMMIMRRKASSCELKLVSIFAFGAENHARFVERFNVYGQEFYGMTEIGGGTYVFAHRLGEMTGSGSCGVPAPYREVIFADDDGNPVPPGQAGELCVRGRGLLQGYY